MTPAARRDRAKPTYGMDGSVTEEGLVAFLDKKGVRVGSTVTADGIILVGGSLVHPITNRDEGRVTEFANGSIKVVFNGAGTVTWTVQAYPFSQPIVTRLAGEDDREVFFDADMLREGTLTLHNIWKAR